MERQRSPVALPHDLERLRERIDNVDEGLVDLMATRLQLARDVFWRIISLSKGSGSPGSE